ncbi:hypothetical protein POM88_005505 [Heracleum sosnowskyi]|uniref:Uncharacterized protein n=1 Tax=Heracleum sosnowskyi TaxID=360622 RepID=A0AAD8N4D9_9APIA|nr:hypothetical protein POM88_005505 [Heracleum sosnowskyi]
MLLVLSFPKRKLRNWSKCLMLSMILTSIRRLKITEVSRSLMASLYRPYDPKYHKFFYDFSAERKARAVARFQEEAEARDRGEIETDEEDDGNSNYSYYERYKMLFANCLC